MKNKCSVLYYFMLSLLLIGCNNSNSGSVNSSSLSDEESSVVSSEISSEINSSIDNRETAQVIVMAGQSNMEGHSWTSKLYEKADESMHNYYRKGFNNTKIMFHCNNGTNISEEFTSVKAGQGYGTGSFGPEVGIAEKLYKINYDKPVYLVKYALGATGLHDRWNVNDNNSLYYEMLNYVDEQIITLEEEGYKVEIKGFFWMQGENDSSSTAAVSSYYDNLTNLVTSFRDYYEDFYGVEDKGIAFVDAGISDCASWKHYALINDSKKQFAESDPSKNYYFSTIDNKLEYDKDNTDYYHFDALSEIKLGELFISQLLDNGWL